MSFKTASALLRGIWLIEPGFAKAHLPLVARMIKGEVADTSSLFQQQDQSQFPKRSTFSSATQSRDVYTMRPWHRTDSLPYGSIAMVDITGPILKYGDSCTYGTVDYENLLVRIANSGRAAGIILNIDSPGGQADGTAMIAQTIQFIAREKMPVISIIQDGIAASAGYWIASAAQELYVTTATDKVGSIGAYTTLYDLTGYFEQMGVKVLEIYAPQSGDKNKDYYDALAGDDSAIKADLKVLVDDFIKSVKTGRGARLNTTGENPFTGKMYFAKEAKSIGLIDGVKSLSQVVQRMESLIKLRA